MDPDRSSDSGESAGEPFVFDEAWARSGVSEASLRRHTTPPARGAAGSNVTGAPAGPRDWAPAVQPPVAPIAPRRRRWVWITLAVVAVAAVVVGVSLTHNSGPSRPPIAGGSIGASAAPSTSDTRRGVEGLVASTPVGACFNLRGTRPRFAMFVSCSSPHRLQLVGIETATGSSKHYPAPSYWQGPVARRCTADLVAYSHQPFLRWPPNLSETPFIPLRDSWSDGVRTIYCTGVWQRRTAGTLRDLRAYHGRHEPIAQSSTSRGGRPPSTSSLKTTIIGRLGLVQVASQVCLTVASDNGAIAIQPIGDLSETWTIHGGIPDAAQSGISIGAHPSAKRIGWHLGSVVTLTGSYVADAPNSCGQTRQFDFSAAR